MSGFSHFFLEGIKEEVTNNKMTHFLNAVWWKADRRNRFKSFQGRSLDKYILWLLPPPRDAVNCPKCDDSRWTWHQHFVPLKGRRGRSALAERRWRKQACVWWTCALRQWWTPSGRRSSTTTSPSSCEESWIGRGRGSRRTWSQRKTRVRTRREALWWIILNCCSDLWWWLCVVFFFFFAQVGRGRSGTGFLLRNSSSSPSPDWDDKASTHSGVHRQTLFKLTPESFYSSTPADGFTLFCRLRTLKRLRLHLFILM